MFKYVCQKIFFVGIIVAFFLILSIYSVSYAAGWRYNNETRWFQKTGLLFVMSQPSKTDIYLDGKKVAGQTPYLSQAVLPGRYTIEIKKDGYRNWEEEIVAEEGLVSQRPAVILFLNQANLMEVGEREKKLLDIEKQDVDTNDVFISADNTELWYQNKLVGRWLAGISQAKIYNQGSHLTFIREGKLYIIEANGGHEIELAKDITGNYVFTDHEKVLIYESMDGLKAVRIR
ncbi:MAG: Uncharacterized protein CEN88_22 [Candidatus Berkelbacteria bacterium Licking1014_2]|uniref:PEGA domain-containing protein n=1 Tax=Candidatus Berkelbacteria bacterium Licking1014_2 TaxID=2017146 RepID=A0A554LX63_9BACT|nr:MAG: Uncharacterized protein CEN88_22 [Candidatus Berkelbacteria bacterium Licking1014_2]